MSYATPNAGSLFSRSVRERVDRDRDSRTLGCSRRVAFFFTVDQKNEENRNTAGQVTGECFYGEMERQRPSNWHSGMHLDFISERLRPSGKISEQKRTVIYRVIKL